MTQTCDLIHKQELCIKMPLSLAFLSVTTVTAAFVRTANSSVNNDLWDHLPSNLPLKTNDLPSDLLIGCLVIIRNNLRNVFYNADRRPKGSRTEHLTHQSLLKMYSLALIICSLHFELVMHVFDSQGGEMGSWRRNTLCQMWKVEKKVDLC